jgi:hypothetical protein
MSRTAKPDQASLAVDLPMQAASLDEVAAVEVGPGCRRRDLPSPRGARVWVVEMDAGSVWPRVDQHDDGGEVYLVLDGEVIEGERRLPAGSYVLFGPESSHRPRSEKGVRLLGFNLVRGG